MIVRQRRRKFSVSLLLFPVFLDIEDSLGNKHKRNNPNNKKRRRRKINKDKAEGEGDWHTKIKGT
jgi:hypothetical protein